MNVKPLSIVFIAHVLAGIFGSWLCYASSDWMGMIGSELFALVAVYAFWHNYRSNPDVLTEVDFSVGVLSLVAAAFLYLSSRTDMALFAVMSFFMAVIYVLGFVFQLRDRLIAKR